jgi:hypothetical protein
MTMATHLPTPAPPHDLATEAAVAVALIDAPGDTIDEVAAVLGPEHFHSLAFGALYRAIVALRAAGQPSDIVTLARSLREAGTLERVGGAAKLGRLVSETPAIADVATHARALRQLAMRRAVVDEARRIAAEGQQPQESVEAWAQDAAARLGRVVKTARPASPWEWVTAAGLDEPLPPIPWVCEDLELAPGPVTIFGGYGYSAKTVTAQSLALAVASGRPAFGVLPVTSGRVRHVDYEQGRRLTQERYQRLGRAMSIRFSEIGDALGFVSLPHEKLDSSATEAILVRELEGVRLAIIDSYRAGAPTIDENASGARVPLDMLARVSETTGCAIVVIHHARKTSEGDADERQILRGSSAVFDAAQSIWTFVAKKGEPTRASCAKARLTGRNFDPFCLHVEDVPRDGDERWGLRVRYEDAANVDVEAEDKKTRARTDAIVAYLRPEERTKAEILDHLKRIGLGMRDASLNVVLDRLARKNVVAESHPPTSRYPLWRAI